MGARRRSLGRRYRWLWAAYAVSAYGSGFGFGAFPLIAIRVLHAGAIEVSALSAAGLAVGAAVALPLGPWVEFRAKRPVMVAMDLVRFAALLTIPAAFVLGWLSYTQLLVVSVLVAAAKIAFTAASGSFLKSVVAPADLLVANGRFESTTWSSTVLGPPLGGAAIGLLGPVVTVLADALSYLLSALGIAAIGPTPADRPAAASTTRLRPSDLVDGWRYILAHPALRRLLANNVLIKGLLLATEPLLALLLLGQLGFAPWQYGLAFAAPCVGGLVGSRLARRLVARFGPATMLRFGNTAAACWPVGLVFVQHGVAGIVLVIVVQFGLVTCLSVANPVLATYRLNALPPDRVARVLSAWTVTGNATIAALTVLWGVLSALTSPRIGIGLAGLLLLATPLLLPPRARLHPAEPSLSTVSAAE